MSLNYDDLAPIYDELYGPEQRRKLAVVASLILGAKSVLDAGCGTGLLAEYLDAQVYHVCLDSSKEMLRHYLHRRRYGDGVVADMSMPPLRCCFDSVVAVTSLHECPRAFPRLVDLTRRGGLVVITLKERLPEPPLNDPRISLAEIIKERDEKILVFTRYDGGEEPR